MRPLGSLGVVALLASTLAAAPASPKPSTTVEGISEYVLANGLRVLLFPDASKPNVTVNVTYFVGSRHEGSGETGMAHLLEHMLFKSTKTRDNIMRQLAERGANYNGSTSFDRTNYFETLPATPANLKWALELEADRMVHSRISKEELAREWSVVKNEFELHENFPISVLLERVRQTAFLWHSYGRPTIGEASDIERVPADNLRVFYQKYYQPDNAMLVVAGKFDAAATLATINATFAKLPRPRRVLVPPYTVEPVQDGEREVVLRRNGDLGAVALAYHGAAGAHADHVAMRALADVLTHEPGGRLHKALVDSGLAAKVVGDAEGLADPDLLMLVAEVRVGQPVDKVKERLLAVAEGLDKISADELERWRAAELRHLELALTDSETLGVELSEWAAQGDWRLLFVFRDRVKALTLDDVQRVARAYLKKANRTLAVLIPEKTPERAPAPAAVDVAKLVAGYKGEAALSEGEVFEATFANIDARTTRVTLANGLELVMLPKRTRGAATQIRLSVRSGSERSLQNTGAAPGFVREATLRGTRSHSYQQLRDRLDRLKAELKEGRGEVGSDAEATYSLKTVRAGVSEVLSLLAEIVRTPSFPQAELEKVRSEKLAALEQMRDEPSMIGMIEVTGRLMPWPKGDPRHVETADEMIADLKALRLADVAAWHKQHWGGQGAILTLVGDFDAAQVKAQVERELGDWRAPEPWERVKTPYRDPTPTTGAVRLKTPDKKMALAVGGVSFPLADSDADAPALTLAAYVFSGGTHSRLMQRLRHKDGISYGAFGNLELGTFTANSVWITMAMCAPANADKALAGLVEELERLVKDGLSDKELKEMRVARRTEIATMLASDEFLVDALDELSDRKRTMAWSAALEAKIDALSTADVTAALRRHVRPAALIKLEAGDLK